MEKQIFKPKPGKCFLGEGREAKYDGVHAKHWITGGCVRWGIPVQRYEKLLKKNQANGANLDITCIYYTKKTRKTIEDKNLACITDIIIGNNVLALIL